MSFAALFLSLAAVQSPAGSAENVDQLVRCRAVAEAAARLACFDGVVDRIAVARRTGEMIVTDRAKVVERKRQRFGLANAPGEMFGGGTEDTSTEVRELETTVASVQPASAAGRFNLQLANGMVWQTIDSLPLAPRVGAAITLKPSLLGGYRAFIKGERPVLAKRLR